MDVIAKIAFGIKVDSQRDKENEFVKKAKLGMQLGVFNPFMFITCKYSKQEVKDLMHICVLF